jgi:hypothetical protein
MGDPQKNLIDWEEVEQVHGAVQKVNREMYNFEKLLPTPRDVGFSHRKKRGLVNIGGEILKFLFGVATTEQVQDIHDTIEGMKDRDGEVIDAIQKQLTYLKTVDDVATQNTLGLATIARALKHVITDAITFNKTFEVDLKIKIALQANISRIMRELEFTAMELQQEFIQL